MIERPKLLLALTKMVCGQLLWLKVRVRRLSTTGEKIGPKWLGAIGIYIASVSQGTW